MPKKTSWEERLARYGMSENEIRARMEGRKAAKSKELHPVRNAAIGGTLGLLASPFVAMVRLGLPGNSRKF